ncbi:hypothetical protein RN001_013187 [Aquatica leii]|uniref:Tyr recombinase domain-containing protein n=1 Tax=Aquatica leii TaxID=1421715 RepID=A0AAN7SCA1_9COLE|nr:hypothetical protein RN001_013187 [Aquatica leii]
MHWCIEKNIQSYSKDVLIVYFSNLANRIKPSTLWSQYSMLRSTLNIKNDIDISKYSKLLAFVKRQNEGYLPKKSRVFTKEQVVLILGIAGACRSDELVNLTIDKVEGAKSVLIIKILSTKTKRPRSFTVVGDIYLSLYQKYVALRPPELVERRLFLRYVNRKCHQMVVGIYKISALLVDGGGDLTCLKSHGGWKSSTVAEGYIEDSLLNKANIAKRILKVDSGSNKPSTVVISDFTTSENNITINENVRKGSFKNWSKNKGTGSSSGLFSFNKCSNCVFKINVDKQ